MMKPAAVSLYAETSLLPKVNLWSPVALVDVWIPTRSRLPKFIHPSTLRPKLNSMEMSDVLITEDDDDHPGSDEI